MVISWAYSHNGQGWQWDRGGRLKNQPAVRENPGKALRWWHDDRLLEAETSDGSRVETQYDVNGNRVESQGEKFTRHRFPAGVASSLMLDFRCIIVPRYVYAARSIYSGGAPGEAAAKRIQGLAFDLKRFATAFNAMPKG